MESLIVRDLGIATYRENILYLRSDSSVCRSEGFKALTRIEVLYGDSAIVATLNIVESELLEHGEAALSVEAMHRLGVHDGDSIRLRHMPSVESMSRVRAKMYGNTLFEDDYSNIMSDIVAGRYSNVEIAAFVSVCAGVNLTRDEIHWLTRAMVKCGRVLSWRGGTPVYDKHCIGGLPGNRTTPAIVAIVAASGRVIPKTSSHAITSPAGTADVMETMTEVDVSAEKMREVVEQEGGCIVSGVSMGLSPADDILISVERALDIDSQGQMIASVLSKKLAAGATNVVIDIPVGVSAKVRTSDDAQRLMESFVLIGSLLGLKVDVLVTDGREPVGMGIGPALEALDVLAVLERSPQRPLDLEARILQIASRIVGQDEARHLLDSGAAYRKFIRICEAQGGFRRPSVSPHAFDVLSESDGVVTTIDNRKLARIAKLAGAPESKGAGILFMSPIGRHVRRNDRLFTIHAASKGELDYAREYYHRSQNIIGLS